MNINKIIAALTLCGALLIPSYSFAWADHHDRDDRHDHRYYDKRHRDYHEWNDHEDRAWRIYWQQQHRRYVGWDRASERQRENYWAWRHSHPDSVLQINIR